METQWILLLDASGSMGSQFTSDYNFSGFVEETEKKNKLEAAKEVLIRQINSLGTDCLITIIQFDSFPEVLFRGRKSEKTIIEFKVSGIEAGGGTNLPEALNLALSECDFKKYYLVHIILISDGLTNEGNIEETINRLLNKALIIDTILINPSKEGEDIARRISINGRVSAVQSSYELNKNFQESREKYEQVAKQAEPKDTIKELTAPITILSGLLMTILLISGKIFERHS